MMKPGEYKFSIEELREKIRTSELTGSESICRFTVEISPTDPLIWVAHQVSSQRNYWRSRDGELEVAGIGNVLRAGVTIEEVGRILTNSSKTVHVFGGQRFDPDNPRREEQWQRFDNANWIVPLIEICSDGDRYTLSCNMLTSGKNTDILKQTVEMLDGLDFDATPPDSDFGEVVGEEPHPKRDRWMNQVSSCTTRLRENQSLDKVVLARHSRLEFTRTVNPWALLLSLREQQPDSYLFAINCESVTFLGAPPERLYCRSGSELKTEAVAGTRARLKDDAADRETADDLVRSHKDITEHDLVVQSIVERLTPLSRDAVAVRKRQLAAYRQVWHLKSPIASELKDGVTDSDLLSSLHPTAAVAGLPREAALKTIAKIEGQDRGWYAGPVGWMGLDNAEFAVAIRSALVADRNIFMYAGAGLVPESIPESEWDESESKMRVIRDALRAPVIV